jgi:streptogramin lyase
MDTDDGYWDGRAMNRFLVVLLVAMSAAIALPAVAGAVTIKEFPISPGATPTQVSPYYVKAGPDGNLWIVNRGTDNGILRVSTTGQPRLPPIEAGSPQDIAVGASGTVYWTETPSAAGGQGRIVSRGPGGIQQFGGLATPFGVAVNPYSIALTPGESIFAGVQVSSTDAGANGVQGACSIYGAFELTCNFPNTAPVKTRYTSAVSVGARDMWVAAFEENVLRRYAVTPGGGVDDEPVEGATLTLPPNSGPSRMVLGPDGNLWIAMFTANAIDRFNLNTAARTRFPLPAGLKGPNDITVGPDGALWFTEFLGNAIGRITTSGQITEFPVPTAASAPYGITTGPDGAIWFTQNATATVGRLTLDAPGGPGGGGGGGGGGGTVVDRVAPRFTEDLAVTRSSFRAGTSSQRGTTFEFSLSEPGRVEITIARKRTGRRVNGRCVSPTRRNRSRSRCDLFTTVGTLRRDGRQGANAVRFSGRLNGRNLRGTYRASAVATDPAGNSSRPSRVTFTVTRR